MGGFEVEIESLERVGHTLADVRTLLGTTTEAARREGAHSLGDRKLDHALRDWADRWDHAIKKLAEASGNAGDQIIEAAKHYRQVEEALTQSIQGQGDQAGKG